MKIAVIGAGAAGLMAAAQAARSLAASQTAAEVVVWEKNNKAGVKILMSGGTRCNLTHDCGPDGIMEAFGRGGRFLRQALTALPPNDVVALFRSLGVETQIESTGKVFPTSNRAVDVRDALLGYARRSGAEIRLGAAVTAIRPDPSGAGFWVRSGDGEAAFDLVVITVGGKSWPGCGTIGEGYRWLAELGHTIVPPRPALVPLVGGDDWMHAISGLTLDDAAASVWAVADPGKKAPKKPLLTRRGGFLFTHFGFSGPTAMDVSGVITATDFARTRLTLDLAPQLAADRLAGWWDEQRRVGGHRSATAALAEWMPKRLAEAVSDQIGAAGVPLAELPKAATERLLIAVKRLALPVTATRGFDKAEVTAGGVSLQEVDPRTMESRIVPGLFIAGEILDLDGWIGGYNFQSAFSTGYVAGTHAARRLAESACPT